MILGGRLNKRGQAIVEFVIILPVLLLLVMMALDLGRVFLAAVTINNTARVGARYAASYPEAWGGTPDAARQAEYETRRSTPNGPTSIATSSPPFLAPSFGGSHGRSASRSGHSARAPSMCSRRSSATSRQHAHIDGQRDIPITSCAGQRQHRAGDEACVAAPTPAPIPTPCPQGTPTLTAVPATQSGWRAPPSITR